MSLPCEACAAFPGHIADWVSRYGYDRSPGPPDCSRITSFHPTLHCAGWRSSYPQEGGEYLYHCKKCSRWWGLVIWTCVNQVDLIGYAGPVAVEAWKIEQPFSGEQV